jgi:hypothetical protein
MVEPRMGAVHPRLLVVTRGPKGKRTHAPSSRVVSEVAAPYPPLRLIYRLGRGGDARAQGAMVSTEWTTFFLAAAGAAAALTGLVFVALSINLDHILAIRGLVGRAGEAILLLLSPVLVGLVALVPVQHRWITGVIVLVIAVPIWLWVTQLIRRGFAELGHRPARERVVRVVVVQVSLLPFIVGGALLLGGTQSGYSVLAAASIAAIGGGVFDAWILLVEILR